MSTENVFQALAQQEWAQAISGSFAFPIFECLHVAALAVLIGSIAILDLRLLGIVGRNQPVSAIARETLAWAWIGFVLVMVTGFLLFAGAADRYVGNAAFQVKLLTLALAGANMAVFHLFIWRSVSDWDVGRTPPAAAIAGGLSLLLWTVVVAAGRWIAFV